MTDVVTEAAGNAIERLFGKTGQRGALTVGDFTLATDWDPSIIKTQELVAIDRFTGGASGGAKFTIAAANRPIMRGTISLDLDKNKVDAAALGMLALLWRDLVEGDIAFGYGATKGYGACHVSVCTVEAEGQTLAALLGTSVPEPGRWHSDDAEFRKAIVEAVKAFRPRDSTEQAA